MSHNNEILEQMRPRLRVCYIAQLAPPPSLDLNLFCRLQGGWNEVEAFSGLVKLLGFEESIDLTGIHVDLGDEPDLDYDAVVVGGSFASVNDGREWQYALVDWFGRWRQTGKPLLGICGGQQLAAVVLGGDVERRGEGPVVGTLPADLTEAGRAHWLFAGMGSTPVFQFAHYDHVTRLPPDGIVLATRDGTVAAIDFGNEWVSTQFHPETTGDRLATYWNTANKEQSSRFYFQLGSERLIANFLQRAMDLTNKGKP